MKTIRINVKKRFSPIEVKITLETPEEAGFFYSIFNYIPVLNATGGVIEGDEIRQQIGPTPESDYDYKKCFKEFKERLELLVGGKL